MTIGMERNNPWDLLPEHIPWVGLVPNQPDSGPLQFDSLEDGIRAGIKLCYTYQRRGWNNPLSFITRFAPALAGNPTLDYIKNVCDWTGFDNDQSIDFHNAAALVPWALAIFRQEQGEDNGVTAEQVLAAKKLADGG